MSANDFGAFAETDLRPKLEALLLVSTDPVSAEALAKVLEESPSVVEAGLKSLSQEYAENGRGFVLREVAGGWRLYTHPAYHELVERYVQSWDTHKLTQAALETLAVIAYTQPATREGVKAVRGVNSDSVISSLVEKGLVREMGRRGGGAIQYGTTSSFLEKFGLRTIYDLPPLEQFAPDEQMRALIRERLSATSTQPTLDQLQPIDDEPDDPEGQDGEDHE